MGWRFGQLPAVGGEWSIAKTPAANKESVEPGAVVVVPLKDGRLGVGQIVAIYDEDWQYYAMFASAYRPDALPSLPELVADDVAMLGLSMDWRISEGAWKVVGTTPALSLTLPTYKVSILDYDQGLDGFYIESADGQLGRAVTDEEAEALAYREMLIPMMIEDALNAFHGLGSWEPWMDQLRYRGVVGSGDRCVPETVEHVSRENVRGGVVEPAAPEHAVVIHVPLSDGEWGGEAERFSLRDWSASSSGPSTALGSASWTVTSLAAASLFSIPMDLMPTDCGRQSNTYCQSQTCRQESSSLSGTAMQRTRAPLKSVCR